MMTAYIVSFSGFVPELEARNSKPEIRNKSKIQNSNGRNILSTSKSTVWNIGV
jgi:hypothetical protein